MLYSETGSGLTTALFEIMVAYFKTCEDCLTKGEETKYKIIQAAIKIFNSEGINWTSFKMLADKVGISQPALYKYFADKDALLLECCLEVVKRGQKFIDDQIDQNSPAQQRLASYVEGNLKWAMEKAKEADLVVAMYSHGSFSNAFKNLHRLIDQGGMKRIETHLIHISFEKGISGSSPGEMSDKVQLIHSLLSGEVLKALRWPGKLSARARTEKL